MRDVGRGEVFPNVPTIDKCTYTCRARKILGEVSDEEKLF